MAKQKKKTTNTNGAPDKSYAEKVYITPQKAKEMLKHNIVNRPPSQLDATKLARVIQLGLWKINGDAIRFDISGKLRDGQTRLAAIIEAGISTWCWVIYDIEDGSFETIDVGRRRTLGHMLMVRGHKSYNSLSTAIAIVYAVDSDIQPEPGGFTNRVGLSIIDEQPEIESSLHLLQSWGIREVWSEGKSAGLHHLMSKADKTKATAYWKAICTGIIDSERSPMLAVSRVMQRNKNATGEDRLSPTSMEAIAIKGWNLYRQDRTCSVVRWNPKSEYFPEIL